MKLEGFVLIQCSMANDQYPSQETPVLCSECGGDVRIVQDMELPKTHRARWIPKLLVVVLLVGLVGVLTVTGKGWRSYGGSPSFITDYSELLDPIQSVGRSGLVDEETGSSREEFIETLSRRLNKVEKQYWGGLIRLVSVEPDGMTGRELSYGVGEEVYLWETRSSLLDVRIPDAWDQDWNPSDTVWVSYGPYKYTRGEFKHNFAFNESVVVNYISIFAIIASCWLLVWVLGAVLRRFGIRSLHSPKQLAVGIGILLLGIVVSSAAFPNDLRYAYANDPPVKTSEWIEYDTLIEIVEQAKFNPDQAEQLWALLKSITPDTEDSDLIVGIQDDFGRPGLGVRIWSIGIGSDIELLSGATIWRPNLDEGENTKTVEFPSEFDRGLSVDFVDRRYFTFGWQSDLYERSVHIAPTSVLSVLAVVIWVWMGLRWIALLIVKRRQRRRISRDQCIFCAYPLSDEGKKARSLGISS